MEKSTVTSACAIISGPNSSQYDFPKYGTVVIRQQYEQEGQTSPPHHDLLRGGFIGALPETKSYINACA
jgi:hypothetical protein